MKFPLLTLNINGIYNLKYNPGLIMMDEVFLFRLQGE